jgi:hypothetical protein
MNIKLICEKKIFNFDLPFEANIKYIKKLSSKLFKCEVLDIYYKGDKITKEENEEKTLLRDIIPEGDGNIKLKIVLNPTLNSTKNQTPSTSNSRHNTNKTIDLGDAKIFENSNNVLLYQNQNNKLFEAIYNQKSKKLFTSIKDFNKKVIEIDNFLFKKKKNYKNDNLNNFEKNLYEFIDGLRIYFTKLLNALDYNNYATYNEVIHNLEIFYDLLNNNEDMGQEYNCQTCREIEDTQINKFPINLKKSDKNFTLNTERYNYFNKSSKKPSIRKELIINNMKTLKNNFDLKTSILKGNKAINKNENKEEIDFIKKNDSNNKKLIVVVGNNNSLSEENNDDKSDDNNKDHSEDKKSDSGDKKLDLNSTKKISESDISKKSINNISAIMNKTSDSNKNIMNEEEINNINNITPNSNKSNDTSENQKVPLNLNLITQKTKKENKLYKEQKTSNRVVQVLNQKPKKKSNLNSTIKENENENCTNSSYCNNNSTNKSRNRNKSINSNSSKNSNKSNNTKYTKKSMNNKSVKSNLSNNNKDKNKKAIDDSIKNKLTKNSKNSEFIKDLNNSNNTNNEVKKNAASFPKTQSSQKKNVKINEPRKSIFDPPIYHISSSNENDMAKALSRKMVMKKKKNKTSNKYDFLI